MNERGREVRCLAREVKEPSSIAALVSVGMAKGKQFRAGVWISNFFDMPNGQDRLGHLWNHLAKATESWLKKGSIRVSDPRGSAKRGCESD
jgi:hypothetical protein